MFSHFFPGNRSATPITTALAVLVIASVPFAQEGALFRVSCGGEGFVDKAGHIWESDAHYEGGQTFSADSAIVNTDMPTLYQHERWNDATPGNLKYTFNVRAGDYRVNLHFAEIYPGDFATGMRVFDVKLNDSFVAQDLDIFAQAGADTPLILDYLTTAQEGKITVEFLNKVGNAKISGIEIIPQNPFRAVAAPYRIHCGGDDYIDPQGAYWEGDGHYTGGAIYVTANTVASTDKSFLYQTERYNGSGDLAYSFDVNPGDYSVRLHFAEIFFQTAGMRVFGVDINGASAVDNLDVAAEAGPNTALMKEFSATAQDGKIIIGFRNGVENAKISGIEILPGAPVGIRAAKGGASASFPIRIDATGAGSLSIRPVSNGAYTATIRDFRGGRIASLGGSGERSVSGLPPGLYLVEIRIGNRIVTRSVPVM